MTERDEAVWQAALEKARQEATHESEIETRAMVYYREMMKPREPQNGSVK